MFSESWQCKEGEGESAHKPKSKKMKEAASLSVVHSSLSYNTIKAPPLVEYNSIDSYCESRPGQSALSSATCLNNLLSIGSPITFKSPKVPPKKFMTEPHSGAQPYMFFSVKELSQVECSNQWTNLKVSAVGLIFYDLIQQQCCLRSVKEAGSWSLFLDTSLLQEIPTLLKLTHIFGSMQVVDKTPVLKVNFCKDVESADLNLFIESYRLMQKYIPQFKSEPNKVVEEDNSASIESGKDQSDLFVYRGGCELNDTLDDYNFAMIT